MEEINEWQQMEQHRSTEAPAIWNMVVMNENYLEVQGNQSYSIYDPPTHEGSLQIVPLTIDPEGGTSSPLTASSSVSDMEGATPTSVALLLDWRLRLANEGKKLLKWRFEDMRVQVVRVASEVCNSAMCTGAFWSITYVAGAAAAVILLSLVYIGIRRGRRKVGRRSMDHSVS